MKNTFKLDAELINVTEIFKNLGKDLESNLIIKSPCFDLFEGTRSLEVDNVKLDSTFITLTEIERNFDCNTVIGDSADLGLQLNHIIGISDRLLKNVILWLNDYQTLPTTILSCRYLEYLLIISEKKHRLVTLSTGNDLYDKVLSGICISICYFAKFVLHLLRSGVLVEEEDLNFNSMGLNFYSYLESPDEIKNLLDDCLVHLKSIENEKAEILIDMVNISTCLVQIEETVTKYSTDLPCLDKLISLAERYSVVDLSTYKTPEGSFSMGIQKRLSNQFPPRNLVTTTNNYIGYKTMAQDIKKVLSVSEALSSVEALQFSYFFNNMHQRHVIARAIFSLFFIRDDQTILGKYTMVEYVNMQLKEFSLAGTVSTLSQLTSEQKIILEPTLEEAVKVLLELYQNSAQNTCRIRQGYNRQLLLWDSLQAQFEQVETLLEDTGVKNILSEENGATYMPYSLWVYAQKITVMIDFVLKGFDLDVYQPYETYSMYYYAYYLSYKMEYALTSVQQFIEKKIHSVQTMNKKIKKLKTAEKKESLKAQYRHLMDTIMPTLQKNKQYLNFLSLRNSAIKSLCLSQVIQFGVLKSYGVIDNKSPAFSDIKVCKLIHDLRFKAFSSIGVPELPPYDIFETTLKDFVLAEPNFDIKISNTLDYINKECVKTVEVYDTILKAIKSGDNNGTVLTGTRLVRTEATEYFECLQESSRSLNSNFQEIIKKLKTTAPSELPNKYRVELKQKEKCSSYFPMFTLIEKTKK